ncbi:cell wall metabolism sensor histidine kinase WalK [Facklamia sp. 7083-14-GEN3]|uniref:sensor histidine kinase n=1 Tax=Facklamia sp. 7083-14-GEN3 TaxID=2973478 RepID=UPI00215C362E|nr:HAMP domain-containing sensor histidine kinase [Facklamia sp. 7083-14-GEN3]MCR8968740.1 HAMP domain-containing histidine kinase [Facklamia sp. 7083-14-GEN3]
MSSETKSTSFFKLKKDHPLSLKWKWGIFLSLSMILLSLISLLIYRQLAIQMYDEQSKESHQTQFESLIMGLSDQEKPFQAKQFLDKNNQDNEEKANFLIEHYSDNQTIIRLFSHDQRLLNESQHFQYPIGTSSKELEKQTIKGKNYLIGSSRISSRNNQELLGIVQYIVLPEAKAAYVQKLNYFLVRCFLLTTLISILCGFLIAHYFLRPLTYVINTLDLLEGDTLSQVRVVRPRTNDEWSDLSLHVNKLLDKIELYVKGQKQFVEDVSHELRTPVAIVEGHLKMLNRWGKEDQQVLNESISASLQEITRMKELVQEMLDLSRADHVDVDYKDEVTEITTAASLVHHNFEILYPDFHFYLDNEKSKKVYVNIYHHHFEQILVILLDNAVKYSTDRPEIHISVSQTMNKVEIAVQDFGEGMTAEDKERVFSRFYRVDKARARAKGGNGLGLSIAKQLVEGYHGKIRVESVYQRGSIFYVEFPILTDQRLIYKSERIAKELAKEEK